MSINLIKQIVIDNHTATIRPFTIKEYRNILSSKDNEVLADRMYTILKSCILESSFELNNMSKALGELVLLHIWVLSMNPVKSESISIDVFCEDCETIKPSIVNLAQSYIHQESQESNPVADFYKYEYPLTENTMLLLSDPTLFGDTDKIDMVISNIKGVKILEPNGGHVILKMAELNKDDFNSLMALIDVDVVKNILELLDSSKCVSLAMFESPCNCEGGPKSMKPLIGVREIIKEIGAN